ncbi:CDKG-2 [Symbiodinium sp. CCMP2456]|nr:CDKG-2 [Symbiodinium sp. CCMP2456]
MSCLSGAKRQRTQAQVDAGFGPVIPGCRSVQQYRKLNRIDEGTYGVVYRACDVETGEVVALKQLKLTAVKSDDGFPSSSLREISLLLEIQHPNVVRCREVVVGNSLQHIFMVMEYVEHELKVLLSKHIFAIAEMKCLLVQLLRGVGHLHQCWILHRDLKTSNILLDKNGVLKICDFGLARHFGQPLRPYTQRVQSLWYRAPEILLGQRIYSSAIDIWSVGCVFGELLLRRPLFEGKTELHQLGLIFGLAGLPSEESWPECQELPNWKLADSFKDLLPGWEVLAEHGSLSALGLDLLQSLLQLCPDRRSSAEVAQQHAYFVEVPQPQETEMLPTFKESNSEGRRSNSGRIVEQALKISEVTDASGDVDVVCFLNEPCVRKGAYQVPHYVVDGYYHDDGPPALDQIVESSRFLHEKLQANKKVLVVCPAGEKFASHRAFSALCTSAYPLLMKGCTLDAAVSVWTGHEVGFRQHSWAPLHKPAPPRHLSLAKCLEALDLAIRRKWLDVEHFNVRAFRDLCAEWDAAWVIPGQILLFADPVTTALDPDPATASHLVPPDSPNFFSWFESNQVTALVRLNKDRESGLDKSYDPNLFVELGMTHIQAAYDDTQGGVPPKDVLKKVIHGCDGIEKAIAFHCKAGFGRSGVCAAVLTIQRFDVPGEILLPWLRMCRPGTITTMQQAKFLQGLRGRDDVSKIMSQADECCTMQ